MRNLRFCMHGALLAGNNRHAQLAMRHLGISYQHCVPQSIADQWWFFNCENIPDPLPEYLTELTGSPYNFIGYGLSSEDAKRIVEYPNSIEKIIADDVVQAFSEAEKRMEENGYFITGTGLGRYES